MKHLMAGILFASCLAGAVIADDQSDRHAIRAAALDYIESQHVPSPSRMDKALHPDLKKRTFWRRATGEEFLLETSRETMLKVAETYNKDGDAFPKKPKKQIDILDIDGRVASVKLTADDWIDYMHLMKLEDGSWKIVNVLWQFNDETRHQSRN